MRVNALAIFSWYFSDRLMVARGSAPLAHTHAQRAVVRAKIAGAAVRWMPFAHRCAAAANSGERAGPLSAAQSGD